MADRLTLLRGTNEEERRALDAAGPRPPPSRLAHASAGTDRVGRTGVARAGTQ
ncbi:hypothetical protein [Streptomyces californicus]|uniref:hypothetical protein n=1 Tax=Streptomyces californicus TaxID=67351 RepID=UPI0037A470FD